jgi:hypothetical protein
MELKGGGGSVLIAEVGGVGLEGRGEPLARVGGQQHCRRSE